MLRADGVSPRFGGGSGLKHFVSLSMAETSSVSPRFGGGSGLKRIGIDDLAEEIRLPSLRRGEWIETPDTHAVVGESAVSPRFGGGSGLKHGALVVQKFGLGLPSLRRGEWIETTYDISPSVLSRMSPLASAGGVD